jgi:hypothetical protein
MNAVRLVLPPAEDAEAAPVAELVLVELLPQAASVRLAAPAASTGIRRRARR